VSACSNGHSVVIALDPTNGSGYLACAHALLGREADDDAPAVERLRHLEAAVRASPDAPRFHQWLARAHERRGRLGEALAHFERALAGSRLQADQAGDSRRRYQAEVKRRILAFPHSLVSLSVRGGGP
jgi:tetratricopeptide (TPR) repeat protein